MNPVEFALANIARVDIVTGNYVITTDVAIDAGKTYYTEAAGVYTAVAVPNVADIATYYEVTGEAYSLIDVATEADVVAFISAGQEQELRVKNVIKAQNNTEDIVKGYDISLTQATFIPEILALVDGGTWDEVTKKYSAPVVGTPVARTAFTMDVYTEQKDGDGSTTGYVKFSYKNCKGRPVNYSVVDGGFFSPQMQIRSRSKFGESPVEVAMLETLPV